MISMATHIYMFVQFNQHSVHSQSFPRECTLIKARRLSMPTVHVVSYSSAMCLHYNLRFLKAK